MKVGTGILAAGLLAVCMTLAFALADQKQHEAVAWLRIRPTEDGRIDAEYDAYRKTQVQLIKSPFVLSAAMRRPGISELATLKDHEDPVAWLAENLKVVAPAESQVIQVRLSGKNAGDVPRIVNAVTAAYLDGVVNEERAERTARLEALETQHKETMGKLRIARETFEGRQRQRLAGKGGQNDDTALDDIALDEIAHDDIAHELESLRTELTHVRIALRATEAEMEVSKVVGETPDAKLLARKDVLKRQAESLGKEVSDMKAKTREARNADVDLLAVQAEISSLEKASQQLARDCESLSRDLAMPARVTLIEEATVSSDAGR